MKYNQQRSQHMNGEAERKGTWRPWGRQQDLRHTRGRGLDLSPTPHKAGALAGVHSQQKYRFGRKFMSTPGAIRKPDRTLGKRKDISSDCIAWVCPPWVRFRCELPHGLETPVPGN